MLRRKRFKWQIHEWMYYTHTYYNRWHSMSNLLPYCQFARKMKPSSNSSFWPIQNRRAHRPIPSKSQSTKTICPKNVSAMYQCHYVNITSNRRCRHCFFFFLQISQLRHFISYCTQTPFYIFRQFFMWNHKAKHFDDILR